MSINIRWKSKFDIIFEHLFISDTCFSPLKKSDVPHEDEEKGLSKGFPDPLASAALRGLPLRSSPGVLLCLLLISLLLLHILLVDLLAHSRPFTRLPIGDVPLLVHVGIGRQSTISEFGVPSCKYQQIQAPSPQRAAQRHTQVNDRQTDLKSNRTIKYV